MLLNTNASRRVALASLLGLAVALVTSATSFAGDQGDGKQRIGLDGYCPVCIVQGGKWTKGNPEIQAKYDGVTYRFPNAEIKKTFLANPAKYVPALGGDCIVCYAMAGKRVPGNIKQAATHGGRLYLFPSDREKKAFLASPKKFADTDLAMNGDCAVCLAHAKKRVPGKAEFTAIHDGLRYQFPSDRERQVFLKSPARYAKVEKSAKTAGTQTKAAKSQIITISGKTTCAACEHGVTPIGAPDKLGLAVNTADGKVFVVEDAHTKWPNMYKARFEGRKVQVKGRIVRTRGKFTWIAPTELKAL